MFIQYLIKDTYYISTSHCVHADDLQCRIAAQLKTYFKQVKSKTLHTTF